MTTAVSFAPLRNLPPQRRLDAFLASRGQGPLWRPNAGPQASAYESEATIVGYGGQAGGGKTDLALGLAANRHKRSVIFRRTFPQLRAIIERSREIFNPEGGNRADDSYNESLHRWMLSDGRTVEFESCQHDKDKEKQRGRPRDLYVFDECTEFTRSMIEFIIAWLRSTDSNQQLKVLLTFNPPTDEAGNWIIEYFLPWLAYLFPQSFEHPNPAKPGELRWYATIEGKETECPDGQPFKHEGELIQPISRTFIPASLSDNPYLKDTAYKSVLQSLPEPLRSQLLKGDFTAGASADPWQVIPTAWVKAAQRRWLEREKPDMPVSGVGVDVARGGRDALVIAKRHGTWFAELDSVPGVNVEDGPAAVGLVQQSLSGDAHIGYINIDLIGVGTSVYDTAKVVWPGAARAINVAAGSTYAATDKAGRQLFSMKNTRAEMHWRLRSALDPETGDNLALPPGNDVVADLCAARYRVLAGGAIQIESKDDIKKRLGRSPDVGDAIMLAWLDRKSPNLNKPPDHTSRWNKQKQKLGGWTV